MDHENFKEQFVEDVKERLYEQGTEVDITVTSVNKLNEHYEALTVKPENAEMGVNIKLGEFYAAIDNGTPYDDVVDKAVEVITTITNVLYLELGVGMNTPVIIKFPFWKAVERNKKAFYACINYGDAGCDKNIADRSICMDEDISKVLRDVM